MAWLERKTQYKLTDVLLLITEHALNTGTNVVVGELDVVLGVTVVLHEGEETIVGDVELRKW